MEWARLVATLARYTGDVGLAEELAQDAVVAALEQWPDSGVPASPGAWLTTVAKRRAIDLFRRNRELERKYAQIGRDSSGGGRRPVRSGRRGRHRRRHAAADLHRVPSGALAVAARVALTLRLLGGLTTAEIARAYLVPEPTIAQRIVRAKKTLARRTCRSRRRTASSARPGCRLCSRSCTSFSTRATRPPRATTGCGRTCATRRSGWAACWLSSRPPSRRCTGWPR